jgi:hypothetical protein
MVSNLIGCIKILRDDARSAGSAFNLHQRKIITFVMRFFKLKNHLSEKNMRPVEVTTLSSIVFFIKYFT